MNKIAQVVYLLVTVISLVLYGLLHKLDFLVIMYGSLILAHLANIRK